jgi:hypothetical protein
MKRKEKMTMGEWFPAEFGKWLFRFRSKMEQIFNQLKNAGLEQPR